MFLKVILCACLFSIAAAAYKGLLAGGLPADLYPAGIDPRTCPNFPHCTNPAVAAIQGHLYQATSLNPARAAIQLQQPIYQPRYASATVRHPQRYSQPEFEFMPSSTQQHPSLRQYTAPRQYAQYYVPSATTSREQQYTPQEQRALDRGEYIGDGDYHGEGLIEALASEYEGQQQSYQATAPVAQYNTPAYQKVSAFLEQSRNVRQTPTSNNYCRNYPHC